MINEQLLSDIEKTVLKFSPLVANAIGGPVGSMVATLLSNWFSTTPVDLNASIVARPDSDRKIKQFETEHSGSLAKITAQNYLTDVDDRKSARDMFILTKDWIVHALSIMFTIGFFVYIILANYNPNDANKEILRDLFGCELLILSFYFGSSFKQNK